MADAVSPRARGRPRPHPSGQGQRYRVAGRPAGWRPARDSNRARTDRTDARMGPRPLRGVRSDRQGDAAAVRGSRGRGVAWHGRRAGTVRLSAPGADDDSQRHRSRTRHAGGHANGGAAGARHRRGRVPGRHGRPPRPGQGTRVPDSRGRVPRRDAARCARGDCRHRTSRAGTPRAGPGARRRAALPVRRPGRGRPHDRLRPDRRARRVRAAVAQRRPAHGAARSDGAREAGGGVGGGRHAGSDRRSRERTARPAAQSARALADACLELASRPDWAATLGAAGRHG